MQLIVSLCQMVEWILLCQVIFGSMFCRIFVRQLQFFLQFFVGLICVVFWVMWMMIFLLCCVVWVVEVSSNGCFMLCSFLMVFMLLCISKIGVVFGRILVRCFIVFDICQVFKVMISSLLLVRKLGLLVVSDLLNIELLVLMMLMLQNGCGMCSQFWILCFCLYNVVSYSCFSVLYFSMVIFIVFFYLLLFQVLMVKVYFVVFCIVGYYGENSVSVV